MALTQLKSNRGNLAPLSQRVFRTTRDGVQGEQFDSYTSFIAFKADDGRVVLGKNWKYSSTTTYYRCQFLGETTVETQAKLDSGEYTMAVES